MQELFNSGKYPLRLGIGLALTCLDINIRMPNRVGYRVGFGMNRIFLKQAFQLHKSFFFFVRKLRQTSLLLPVLFLCSRIMTVNINERHSFVYVER